MYAPLVCREVRGLGSTALGDRTLVRKHCIPAASWRSTADCIRNLSGPGRADPWIRLCFYAAVGLRAPRRTSPTAVRPTRRPDVGLSRVSARSVPAVGIRLQI